MTKRVVTAPTKPAEYHRTALSPQEWQARQKEIAKRASAPPASEAVKAK